MATPSLHRVPAVRFPGFSGTMSDSDFSTPIPPSSLCLARQYQSAAASFDPSRPATADGEKAGALPRRPPIPRLSGDVETSQVPGEPLCRRAPLDDPGGPRRTHHAVRRDAAFRLCDTVGIRISLFRGSITRPICLLSTLRSAGRPCHHARLATGLLATLWPGGTCTHWVPFPTFKVDSSTPPLQSGQAFLAHHRHRHGHRHGHGRGHRHRHGHGHGHGNGHGLPALSESGPVLFQSRAERPAPRMAPFR